MDQAYMSHKKPDISECLTHLFRIGYSIQLDYEQQVRGANTKYGVHSSPIIREQKRSEKSKKSGKNRKRYINDGRPLDTVAKLLTPP